MIRKVFYFCLALFLSYFLTGNESFIPDPPSLSSSNYILIDSTTNRILAQKNPDERIEPASITKIMTGYVVSDQVEEGFINLQDEVFISENCWRKEGSKMWIREGTTVSLLDLIKGMVIQSGNDASCAIAEHVAGSEENFVELMMKYVKRMGLSNTNFVNATGWPEENHYSSARDIAKLSSLLIKDFPEHYSLYKEKSFTYNNIPQRNRNALLWQDDS
ncbi:MAG TPA: D-alanyl-D-alanine carboxypeptidase, partial [Gammaproteobacteria bacterium]|nr:D-alanyl-D-alanine carboxypeptidase [Gammaproteobacteria bacterium]